MSYYNRNNRGLPARAQMGQAMPASRNGNGAGMNDPRSTCGPIVGNAGIKGCGIGDVPCGYQVLAAVIRDVPAAPAGGIGPTVTLAMQAGRALAFQPKYVYMFGVGAEPDTSELNTRFELQGVTVMTNQQLIQEAGPTEDGSGVYSVLSDAYNRPDHPVPVSWATFGDNNGQSIRFQFASLSDVVQDIHVILWGDAADPSLVGQCLTSVACR